MDDYEFEDLERKIGDALKGSLTIDHTYSLNNRGQKFITISVKWNYKEISSTDILIGQAKDLHDYSTDFEEQILP